MGHKDLPLSFFFTLPQNKLSLDHFHIVPRLSYSLGLKRKGGWQIFTACLSLAQPIKLGIFQILVVFSSPKLYSCLPVSPSSSPHAHYIPASFLPWLLFSLFLLPLAVLTSTPFTSMNPKTAHAPLQLQPWGHSPQPSSSRDPCCHQHLCPWGLHCSSQALQSSAHLSSCIYFCKTSYVHSHFCSTRGPGLLACCSIVGSRLVMDLLWSLLNKSFAFVRY